MVVVSGGSTWQTLATGGAVAAFGFALAMAWDSLKSRREQGRREKALLVAARGEIAAIRSTIQNNQNLVMSELSLLDQGKHLINPLDPVEGGFWDIVKLNPPPALVRKLGTLATIRQVSRLTAQVNEMIRSREAFRISNLALHGFDERLRKYDELLQRFQGELIVALDELAKDV